MLTDFQSVTFIAHSPNKTDGIADIPRNIAHFVSLSGRAMQTT
jgi:hypothetical protein